MTSEEIERILQTVAENQARITGAAARADERLDRIAERLDQVAGHLDRVATLQTKHSTDIGEIDRMLVTLVQSQNRYDAALSRHDDILHDLADKHLKNEERFTELAETRRLYEARMEKMEASYQLLEAFVRDFRNETNGRFADADRLFAETDKKLTALAAAQVRTDEQINALVAAQASTDEQIRLLLVRNGAKKPRRGTTKTAKKKAMGEKESRRKSKTRH